MDPNQQTIHKFFTKLPPNPGINPREDPSPGSSHTTVQQTDRSPSTMRRQNPQGNDDGRKGHSQSQPGGYADRRAANAATAKETRSVLPDILKELPHIQASRSEALHLDSLPPLRWADCPRHHPPTHKTKIRIVNDDTFNAAVALSKQHGPAGGRVAVLNMASHSSPGGGWLKGATAQEEALCYRSSLSLSLHKRYYPWKHLTGLYTPDVVVIRSDMTSGHNLLWPELKATDLPVVSVLSVAAVRGPEVSEVDAGSGHGSKRRVFAKESDRVLTKGKMRLSLRMAAARGHGLLVLGALGCGAFRNPPEEVARCWREVLEEAEFGGGWWREVWFAVLDNKHEGNLEVFESMLGGLEV